MGLADLYLTVLRVLPCPVQSIRITGVFFDTKKYENKIKPTYS